MVLWNALCEQVTGTCCVYTAGLVLFGVQFGRAWLLLLPDAVAPIAIHLLSY